VNFTEDFSSVQFSSVVMSCSKLPLLMLISSMSHELVEADLERVDRTGSHNWFRQTVPFINIHSSRYPRCVYNTYSTTLTEWQQYALYISLSISHN